MQHSGGGANPSQERCECVNMRKMHLKTSFLRDCTSEELNYIRKTLEHELLKSDATERRKLEEDLAFVEKVFQELRG